MQRDKGVAFVFRGKLRGLVESDAERRRMGLDQHVGHDDLVGKIGPLVFVVRILMGADVIPGPAVEAAFRDMGRKFRRQIVAQNVALVDDAPQRRGFRLDRHAGAIAQPSREDAPVAAVGIEGEHVGAIFFRAPCRAERMARLGTLRELRLPFRGCPCPRRRWSSEPTETNISLCRRRKIRCRGSNGRARRAGRTRRLQARRKLSRSPFL